MNAARLALISAALLGLAAGPALADPAATTRHAAAKALAGQKLDSGLGELPHYRLWADPSGRAPLSRQVAGESLDNGLGELPHYSLWLDPTGRDPLGRQGLRVAGGQR